VPAAAAPPPAATLPTRHLDVGRCPSPPLLSCFARATTPEPPPAATSSPPCSAPASASLPSLLCPAVPVDNTQPISISFPLAVCTPSPITTATPLLPSGELLGAVDSRRRPPIAPTDPLASFPSTCSCSPAPKRRRISARAPLPATTACRRPLLAVEHPFPTLLDPN
jgi:hypothetical protein